MSRGSIIVTLVKNKCHPNTEENLSSPHKISVDHVDQFLLLWLTSNGLSCRDRLDYLTENSSRFAITSHDLNEDR